MSRVKALSPLNGRVLPGWRLDGMDKSLMRRRLLLSLPGALPAALQAEMWCVLRAMWQAT